MESLTKLSAESTEKATVLPNICQCTIAHTVYFYRSSLVYFIIFSKQGKKDATIFIDQFFLEVRLFPCDAQGQAQKVKLTLAALRTLRLFPGGAQHRHRAGGA
jgi:hypothetical protein